MGASLSGIQPSAPRGWYPAPDSPGQLRYWDGATWTKDYLSRNAAPEAVTPTATSRKAGCFPTLLVWATAAIIVLGGVAWVSSWSPTEDQTTSTASLEREPAQAPQKSAAEIRDKSMTAQGYKVGQSGDVYFKAAEPGASACGSFRCLSYSVLSLNGCPAGIYMAASIENGDISVGKTNSITAGLQAEQVAIVRLEDYTNAGSKFRVTEVTCLG